MIISKDLSFSFQCFAAWFNIPAVIHSIVFDESTDTEAPQIADSDKRSILLNYKENFASPDSLIEQS